MHVIHCYLSFSMIFVVVKWLWSHKKGKLMWGVACLLLYKLRVCLNHSGAQLAFFILAGSLSLGKGKGLGESGSQKEERAVAVAFGGVGTLLIPDSRATRREPGDYIPHAPPSSNFQAGVCIGLHQLLEQFCCIFVLTYMKVHVCI